MTGETDIRSAVRRYLAGFSENDILEASDEDDLLAAGVVDSLAVLELVNFVEVTYDVFIPDDDFELERFQSINAVTELVIRLRSEQKL
ncbi:acyl carrier protein [Microbacterium enclense]|uniref:acyl carrier protein n=1 Tax=Microbacterium enclense TaxID=993073 RepID=UPI003F7E329A